MSFQIVLSEESPGCFEFIVTNYTGTVAYRFQGSYEACQNEWDKYAEAMG